MTNFFYGWRRKTGCVPRSWKLFFLTTAGICVIVDGLVAYAVQRSYRNFAIAPGVVTKVEFQNIMKARYIVGDQPYELRELVSPKYVRGVGHNVFVRYEIARPTNSSIAPFSAPWMEIVATSFWLSLYIIFIAFSCYFSANNLNATRKNRAYSPPSTQS